MLAWLLRQGSGRGESASPRGSKSRRWKQAKRNFKFKLRDGFGEVQLQRHLTTSFLNVDGLSDAKLADFSSLKSPDLFFRGEGLSSDRFRD